jgi:hypothetical protein
MWHCQYVVTGHVLMLLSPISITISYNHFQYILSSNMCNCQSSLIHFFMYHFLSNIIMSTTLKSLYLPNLIFTSVHSNTINAYQANKTLPCLDPLSFYKIWFLAIAYKNWCKKTGWSVWRPFSTVNQLLLSSL